MSPRTFPPAPGWSPDGHRIKALLDYGRGPDKVWVYGALRPCDGQALTFTAPSRNTAGFRTLLDAIEKANPAGDLYLINDNLSSHSSGPIREWLTEHPRVHQEPLPTGHRSAQSTSETVDLGTTAPAPSTATTPFCLLALRNGALETV